MKAKSGPSNDGSRIRRNEIERGSLKETGVRMEQDYDPSLSMEIDMDKRKLSGYVIMKGQY